jgi:Yip1 domain
MHQSIFSKYDKTPTQSLTFIEALVRLPLQYIKVITRPSENTFREQMGKASWAMVLVQFIGLVIVTVALGVVAHVIPSAALHTIAAFNIGQFRPLAFLPSPFNGITLVLASFFIGLGTAYVFSKFSGGQGTFLAHLYCLLLCTVPLVTISGAILLIPATGSLVLVAGCIVSALFIYRMVLHTFTVMAVHQLDAGRATLIILIIPMVILALIVLIGMIGLLFLTEGEGFDAVFEWFSWAGVRRREPR